MSSFSLICNFSQVPSRRHLDPAGGSNGRRHVSREVGGRSRRRSVQFGRTQSSEALPLRPFGLLFGPRQFLLVGGPRRPQQSQNRGQKRGGVSQKTEQVGAGELFSDDDDKT